MVGRRLWPLSRWLQVVVSEPVLTSTSGGLKGKAATLGTSSNVPVAAGSRIYDRFNDVVLVLEENGVETSVSELATCALEAYLDVVEAEYAAELALVQSMDLRSKY